MDGIAFFQRRFAEQEFMRPGSMEALWAELPTSPDLNPDMWEQTYVVLFTPTALHNCSLTEVIEYILSLVQDDILEGQLCFERAIREQVQDLGQFGAPQVDKMGRRRMGPTRPYQSAGMLKAACFGSWPSVSTC
jgi:hypothetical protein